jgi:hypothetical protein
VTPSSSGASSIASISTPTDLTASSAVGVATTEADGRVTTVTPSSFASTLVTTSGGQVYTVTVNVHNPSGALDSGNRGGGGGSSFFNNTGAVAGVFVVVGLVVVGVAFALGLLCFRRRRRQRLDREVTAAAIAASHNSGRSPLDEDADVSSGGPHTSESYPSSADQPMAQYNNYGASYGNAGGYDGYGAAGAAATGGAAAGGAAYGQHQGQYSDAPAEYGGQQGAYDQAGGYSDQNYGNQNYDNGQYAPAHADGGAYYFDPREAGNYQDLPSSQQPLSPQQYDDPYAGYGEGEPITCKIILSFTRTKLIVRSPTHQVTGSYPALRLQTQ